MTALRKPKCGANCRVNNDSVLCEACVQYANRDFVPQRETLMAGQTIDKIDPSTFPFQFNEDIPRSAGVRSLNTIFRQAKLTRRQRKVLRLYLIEGKNFFEIGEHLKISRASAHEHYQSAIKKSRKHLTKLAWVKDLDFKNPEDSPQEGESSASNSHSSEVIDPYQFYSACADCGHWDLQAEESGGSCVACGWEFTIK